MMHQRTQHANSPARGERRPGRSCYDMLAIITYELPQHISHGQPCPSGAEAEFSCCDTLVIATHELQQLIRHSQSCPWGDCSILVIATSELR